MSQTQELSPSASLERQEEEPKKKTKTRRPPNTAFRQQRLKAWQPILTPKTVLPIFYVVGVLFALFGGLMLWASTEVQELALDYTDCGTSAPDGNILDVGAPMGASRVVAHFNTDREESDAVSQARWAKQSNVSIPIGTQTATYEATNCTLEFLIPNNINPPIFLYYRLTNFYQNHRRYVKSLDQDQLAGTAQSNDTVGSSLCTPLQLNGAGKAYYPCGLIANSLFNDTIGEPVSLNSPNAPEGVSNVTYAMTTNGIGWSSDGALYQKTKYTNDQVVPPPNWEKRYPGGVYSDEFPIPNINEMENFWVWMRTAGLPTFSKLARRNTDQMLPGATYQIQIVDNFPAHLYGGTKQILISTRTVIGGKNPFLGIAYVVVAGICIVLAVIFTAMNLIRPRKLGDHRYLSWNNDQPSTATVATGRN